VGLRWRKKQETRELLNEKLHGFIPRLIKERKMRWTGHVLCMREKIMHSGFSGKTTWKTYV
jgi:hypothetical protein